MIGVIAHNLSLIHIYLCSRKSGFITIFYGEGADEQQAEQVKEMFAKEAKNAEITVIEGGQPVYSYIISVE